MSYVIQSTRWLSNEIDEEIKNLIARFYELADSKVDDAGPLMATEVFAADGVLVSPNGTFRGREEIATSRLNAWTTVNSRRHAITTAFWGQGTPREMMLLGTVHMELLSGCMLDASFSCHLKFAPQLPEVPHPRLSFMEVFANSGQAAQAKE